MKRHLPAALLAAGSLMAAAACGSDGGGSPSGAKPSASRPSTPAPSSPAAPPAYAPPTYAQPAAEWSARHLVDRSRAALLSAPSYRVDMSSNAFSANLVMDSEGDCEGIVNSAEDGLIDIVKVGDDVWYRPEEQYWENRLAPGADPADLSPYRDKFLHDGAGDAAAGPLGAAARLCDMQRVADTALLPDPGEGVLEKRGDGQVNGQDGITVDGTAADGTARSLMVAADGAPYPLTVTGNDLETTSMVFSEFGAPVAPRAPAAEEAVELTDALAAVGG